MFLHGTYIQRGVRFFNCTWVGISLSFFLNICSPSSFPNCQPSNNGIYSYPNQLKPYLRRQVSGHITYNWTHDNSTQVKHWGVFPILWESTGDSTVDSPPFNSNEWWGINQIPWTFVVNWPADCTKWKWRHSSSGDHECFSAVSLWSVSRLFYLDQGGGPLTVWHLSSVMYIKRERRSD